MSEDDYDEDALVPEEWFISRICEEFGVPLVPGGALDQPLVLTSHIMRLRGYKRALEVVEDRNIEPDKVPVRMANLVGKVQSIVKLQDHYRQMDEKDAG